MLSPTRILFICFKQLKGLMGSLNVKAFPPAWIEAHFRKELRLEEPNKIQGFGNDIYLPVISKRPRSIFILFYMYILSFIHQNKMSEFSLTKFIKNNIFEKAWVLFDFVTVLLNNCDYFIKNS